MQGVIAEGAARLDPGHPDGTCLAGEGHAGPRRPSPVHPVPQPDGDEVWLITRYEEACAALTDPRLSSDMRRIRPFLEEPGRPGSSLHPRADGLDGRDPPEHTRLRRLVDRALTHRRVEALRPWVEYLSDWLLSEIAGADEIDLLAAFAYPLPASVICELIGVPLSDREEIRRCAKRMVEHEQTGGGSGFGAWEASFAGYLSGLVEATAPHVRHSLPEDQQPNLVRALLAVSEDGNRLSHGEIVETLVLLLAGGYQATAHLIGNGTLALLRHPGQRELLRRQPYLWPNAVEELLRCEGPVERTTLRFSLEPLTIGCVTIPAHRMVGVVIASANHDPARFWGPDRLDVARRGPRHLGFGHGPHVCPGAPLARLQAEIALQRLLTHFPDLQPARPLERLRYPAAGHPLRGLRTLPVRLHGRRRR